MKCFLMRYRLISLSTGRRALSASYQWMIFFNPQDIDMVSRSRKYFIDRQCSNKHIGSRPRKSKSKFGGQKSCACALEDKQYIDQQIPQHHADTRQDFQTARAHRRAPKSLTPRYSDCPKNGHPLVSAATPDSQKARSDTAKSSIEGRLTLQSNNKPSA